MLIEESERRQKDLKSYLYEMASSSMEESEIRKMAIKLKSLYSDGFRHCYSDFFPIIVEISGDDNEYSLDYLTTNLENTRSLVESDYIKGGKEFSVLYKPLTKLSDHINLECARYSYYSINEQKVKDLETKNRTLQKDLSDATAKLQEAASQASNMQTQYTTILGIFAAIILAFVGSLTFSTSVLEHVADANVFQLLQVALVIGLVFFNLIYLLLDFLREINRLKNKEEKKEKNIFTGQNSVFWSVNAIIVGLMLVTGICWCRTICK